MITLYDVATMHTGKTCSPNPWKTRYVLNYKKLPYNTRFVEFPDIEAEYKKAGIPPNGQSYTSPSITDDNTGAAVTDSYKIAEYLDKTYPTTPKVIPPGTEALQAAFYDQVNQIMVLLAPLLSPKVPAMLCARSAEYFIKSRTVTFGKPLDQVAPVGDAWTETFGKVKAAFEKVDGWRSKSSGPFFMGETMTFADIVVVSMFQGLKVIWGEDSDEWREIKTWSDGRWIELMDKLEPYASQEN